MSTNTEWPGHDPEHELPKAEKPVLCQSPKGFHIGFYADGKWWHRATAYPRHCERWWYLPNKEPS